MLDMTLQDAAIGLRGRRFSSVELTAACLSRIDDLDPQIGAFLTVMADRALACAQAADVALSARRSTTPLTGIPVAVKDIIDTASSPTTANSRVWRDRVPTKDAGVVSRLKKSGAIVLGKTQTNEFALGRPGDGDLRPPPRNPWNNSRTTGGSSSGSAAALSARMCFAAIGTDTGGSIRAPASHCGVVGMKPTLGRISRTGVAMLSWTLDHVGPMARTVGDVAVVLSAISGRDPHDTRSSREAVADYGRSLGAGVQDLKVGVPEEYIASLSIQHGITTRFREALDVLHAGGAAIGNAPLPSGHALTALLDPIVLSEAATLHHRRVAEGQPYGQGFRERILQGMAYSAIDYAHALRARAEFIDAMKVLMRTFDVIAMPTMSVTAPPYDAELDAVRSPFTGYSNVSGQPAVTVPCGLDEAGLPVGVMLVGRWFEEATVLRAARVCEAAFAGIIGGPDLAGGSLQ